MRSANPIFAAGILLALLAPSGPAQPADWEALDREIEQLFIKGDLAGAIRVAQKALDAATNPKQSGRSLDRLGFLNYSSGNLKDGEAFLTQSLELRKSKLGVDTADYAESANDMALLYRDTNRVSDARALAEQAVAIRSRVLGSNDPLLAETLNTLATIHSYAGEYELAATRFEEARAIHESHLDPDHPDAEYGTLCVNMAGNYQRMGQYAKAEDLFQKGLAVLRKNPGVDHPSYSVSLIGLAYLQTDLGNYAVAEKVYNEADGLLKRQLGEQHPMYAGFLNNRGFLYYSMGNVAAAESDYRKSLELKRKIFTPDNPNIGATLRNLARLVYSRDPAEGEKLFREAVEIYAKSPKPPAFDYASVLIGLGEAERNRGDLDAALRTFQKALEATAQGLGTKHPLYASALSNIGLVHQAAHEYAQAGEQLKEAAAIVRETHGENHPDLARYLELLAKLDDETGDYRAAEPLYRRSFEITDRFLTDILNVGSESNKAMLFQNLEDPIPALLAFQQRAGARVPEARALAFEAVARRKGRVLDQVRDWRQSLEEDTGVDVHKRLREWEAMLECQASLTTALGYRDLKPAVVRGCALEGTELEGRYGRLLQDLRTKWTAPLGEQTLVALEVLKQRIDLLEAGLSRELPKFRYAVKPAQLYDMKSSLAPDELLVEFVDYGRNQRYGAFLLDHSGGLEWVDLGPAKPVDRAVRDLMEAANDWSVSLTNREPRAAHSAEETAQDALNQLSEKLLKPVTARLNRKTPVHRLRIAPDGMLTLVPFGALSDDRGRFLLERFAISYVSAGRDLVESGQEEKPDGPPVIALSPGSGAKPRAPIALLAGTFRADKLERLASAEAEARSLQERMPRALLLAEGEATEERVKQLHRPALLHIVGHGLVRGNEDCQADSRSPGCALTNLDPAARVMSLSAIVLEEAYGRGRGSTQDGLLTALELESLDLHGSEMLVLSQCRMADGVPASGEGVYGMRRAAAIAGVRTFVAPLWRVADSAQQALMDRFYKELSLGRSRAEALRQAQLQLLGKTETRSFLYWAPVILSGDPAPLPRALFER
jgi:CHAT domain-containing protein